MTVLNTPVIRNIDQEIEPLKALPTLKLATKLREEYEQDGFFGLIIKGKQRIGKSSYMSQALAAALGKWERIGKKYVCVKIDFEAVKKWIVFMPKEFLNLVLSVKGKEVCAYWDDAGFWLFALDWYEPFVKAVSKYMQLGGTQFGCIAMTTPSESLISTKVLGSLPNYYTCKVTKVLSDTENHKKRCAKVYETWEYPDNRKGGVWTQWEDYFDAMLPNEFYEWYKPKRDAYLDMAKNLLQKEVKRVSKQMTSDEEKDYKEEIAKVTGGEERLKELTEVSKMLSTQ